MSPADEGPWRLPRGRHGLPREMVERSQRERLIAAVVRVTARKGYEATSVADLLEASGVGRATFYELFEDKEACFVEAHTMLIDDLYTETSKAYEQPGPWPDRIRYALSTLLDWFSEDADVARVVMVEAASVGSGFRERFRGNLLRFTSLLDEGREHSESAKELPNISSIAAGAVFVRIYEEVVLHRAAELPTLLPQLTYDLLLPFLGEKEAREAQRKAEAS